MTDREIMQMALDAMESFESGTNGLYKGEFAEERKALRDRLAQPEPEPVIETLHDGALVLSFNALYPGKDVMETDLVFAAGAFVKDDPTLKTQREIMEEIVRRWNCCRTQTKGEESWLNN